MRYLRAALGVVVSALMFVLAMPPADVGILGWIALAPLLLGVRGGGFAVGFIGGLLTGALTGWLAAQGWFYAPSIPDGNPGWIYTGFALFGAVMAGVGGIAAEVKEWTPLKVFGLAAAAVLLEMLSMLLLPVHIALSQYRWALPVGLAATTGIWGVSYLLWLSNAAIAAALSHRRGNLVIAPAVAVVAMLAVGGFMGRTAPYEAGVVPVAAIQTDVLNLAYLSELNAKAGAQGALVVVWPELSAQTIAARGNTVDLVALAASEGQPNFATTFRDDHSPLPHNAASVFTANGESVRYFKRKPFAGEKSMHLAGTEPVVVGTAHGAMGLNVCYDSCFPAVMRETAQKGAEIILLPTMDPISPGGAVQALHAAYTPFRAAELGVPIVRADITAYSMIVDARGQVVAEAGSGSEEIIHATVQPGVRRTMYMALGDWFLYVSGLLALAQLVAAARSKRSEPIADEAVEKRV